MTLRILVHMHQNKWRHISGDRNLVQMLFHTGGLKTSLLCFITYSSMLEMFHTKIVHLLSLLFLSCTTTFYSELVLQSLPKFDFSFYVVWVVAG